MRSREFRRGRGLEPRRTRCRPWVLLFDQRVGVERVGPETAAQVDGAHAAEHLRVRHRGWEVSGNPDDLDVDLFFYEHVPPGRAAAIVSRIGSTERDHVTEQCGARSLLLPAPVLPTRRGGSSRGRGGGSRRCRGRPGSFPSRSSTTPPGSAGGSRFRVPDSCPLAPASRSWAACPRRSCARGSRDPLRRRP